MLTINNTIDGAIQDIEIKGNTVQNPDNLADIKSVGVLQEDDTYKMSILSCGKNLFDGNKFTPREAINQYSYIDGILTMSCDGQAYRRVDYILPNTLVHGKRYILTANVKALEYSSGYTPGQNFGYGYYNGGSADYYGYFDASSNTTKLEFVYNEQGENVIGFHNEVKEGLIKLQWSNIQLEEGTVATTYEPYQGNKCDILLPCQLEKVGNVSDRLYYDDVEKDWCIEKNIETLIINGIKQNAYVITGNTDTDFIKIGYKLTEDTYNKYKGFIANIKSILPCESESKFKNNSLNTECITLYNGGNNYAVYLSLSKAKYGDNLESVLNKLEEDSIYLYVVRLTPQKIVLPLSTQIQLNSFFGTTHVYMESGEVEGTIKCKIPKSLGATVQSLNNKTDILSDRIEAIEGLKDSQNMKYETDKGYLVCKETKNGVIDDLKIEGKTLIASNYIEKTTRYARFKVKPNTNYTYVMMGLETTHFGVFDKLISDIPIRHYERGQINTFNSGNNDEVVIHKSNDYDADNLGGSFLIEGDHTQNPPSYFEGLMSVGQDVDKIEVLSRKEDGNLLFFNNDFSYTSNGITYTVDAKTQVITVNGTCTLDNTTCTVVDALPKQIYNGVYSCTVEKLTDFSSPIIVRTYNKDYSNGVVLNIQNSLSGTVKKPYVNDVIVFSLRVDNGATFNNAKFKVSFYKGDIKEEYTPHQSDKKQILFYNSNGELEPIQELHEWDSIEKHSDNKWYYHKRSGEVVLNGSENWQEGLSSQFTDTHMYFACNSFDSIMKDSSLISDKFENKPTWDILSRECIDSVTSINKLRIRLAKSKLSTQDVTGFKQWLQANNVTVVYQLAEEKVYELAPLHLDSYANETLILCNSGAISPRMEFSITSHINELVKAYGERINLLEGKVYKYMVTQNRMQLASTYSADSVTFKVDYFSLCGDEENYDEDLYNLILNNILVGKDNYNYDKMFTIILDYASWNQISWEQFDILVGLMDMQHNPPVEELPTEDEIEEDIIEETPVE